ncbi:MAG: hypothetical protein JWP85_2183 [Rhodoglobus sp.]|nr:hypothetical protein [Rhodoglobus sp.]
MTPKTRIVAAVLVGSALVLTACGQVPFPVPSASPTSTASPTPTVSAPSPTPTPLPTADGEVLFTISAKLTSPVGATAHVEQVVYKPESDLDDLDAITTQLDDECTGWRESIGPADYVVGMITAEDTSTGGKKWPPSGQVVVTMAGTPVFAGDWQTFQSFCTSVQVLVPGEVRGVTPVPAGGDADSPGGWATLTYGFGIATEAGTDATDRRYTQLSDCRITLTAAARAESDIVEAWLAAPQASPGLCEVNTPGV